jgi:hypothetical protein
VVTFAKSTVRFIGSLNPVPAGLTDEDETPETAEQAVSAVGDVWRKTDSTTLYMPSIVWSSSSSGTRQSSETWRDSRRCPASDSDAVLGRRCAHEIAFSDFHPTLANDAAIANALRCCLHISSASFGSVVCGCVGHAALSSSSR